MINDTKNSYYLLFAYNWLWSLFVFFWCSLNLYKTATVSHTSETVMNDCEVVRQTGRVLCVFGWTAMYREHRETCFMSSLNTWNCFRPWLMVRRASRIWQIRWHTIWYKFSNPVLSILINILCLYSDSERFFMCILDDKGKNVMIKKIFNKTALDQWTLVFFLSILAVWEQW